MVEVFPVRDMFIQEEQWLSRSWDAVSSQESERRYATSISTVLLTVDLIVDWCANPSRAEHHVTWRVN